MSEEILAPGIYRHGNRFRVQKMVAGTLVRRSFETLPEARAHLDLLERDVAERRAVQAARLTGGATVMDIVLAWWLGPQVDGEHRGGHRQRVKARTQRDYEQYINSYITRVGHESAQSYARNPALLKLFYDSLPNRMAWHVHSVMRQAFREALARGLVDRNPCELEKPAKRKRKRRLTPSRPEVDIIVAAAEEERPRWGLFCYLTSTLGTRCGETCAFRPEDFDEKNNVVHVERAVSKTKGGITIKEPKKGEARDLLVDDPAFWDYVRRFLDEPGYLFKGFFKRMSGKSEDKPWHPDYAQQRFRKMIRKLGLPAYTLHSLRHFVATQLLIEGAPVNQVAEFLGHTPQMTLTLYGRHLDREAMLRVGRAATRLVTPRPPSIDKHAEPRDPVPVDKAQALTSEERAHAGRLVVEMAASGPVTNAALRAKTGLTRRQVARILEKLVVEGRLVLAGEKRGAHYVLPARRTQPNSVKREAPAGRGGRSCPSRSSAARRPA